LGVCKKDKIKIQIYKKKIVQLHIIYRVMTELLNGVTEWRFVVCLLMKKTVSTDFG
jgi:hypothetical protein